MINLLPPEVKQGYKYARRNTGLRRWVAACLLAFVGLGLISTYGLLTIQQSSNHLKQQISANNALFTTEKFSQTQTQVQDISNSFKLVVKVLSQEILFSQLIKQVTVIIPQNTNLTGLKVDPAETTLDITADAKDYNAATQVQLNLADPTNKIFDKADINSITCVSGSTDDTTANADYPCTVDINALFSANNPFLFINSKAVQP